MQPEVLTALITSVASVIVAAITAFFTTTKAIAQLQVKVDLLWKTYIVDAVSASRASGMVARNSPENATETWNKTIPIDIRRKIDLAILAASKHFDDPYDVSLEVLRLMYIDLQRFALSSSGISMKELMGAVFVLARNHVQEEQNYD